MNKKIVIILSSMLLIIGLTGCKQQVGSKEETKRDFTISDGYAELKSGDLEIVKWSYSAKEPNNPDKNSANFIGEVTMGSKDIMSKKAVNINLREGQSLKIETNIDYPITVMLKDNSNEEYIFNKTLSPVNSNILVDEVKKDGQYELMVDFNEIDEFTFKVFIVDKK
ncbi:MAG: hypothetical protein RR486_16290 [Clostridium sp.]|uniref:hypothetical protein n=1 Tax=Clostridium sp. TaxID=1506 RepID=UPI0030658DF7